MKSWFIMLLIMVLLSATTIAAAQETIKPNETDETLESDP
jgi:hypothetical protein